MKKLTLIFTLITTFFISYQTLFAKPDGQVAKVIILKGKVKSIDPESKAEVSLKKGSWIKEGATVQTSSKSFVKLLFIDKSQMSLGPKSSIVINQFKKKKAGIINLLKGQLRSKVTKDYMQMDKDKSKLFIQTKTAAMGVRGTDFQVNYNRVNNMTSLVTFEGAVAMGKLDKIVGRSRNMHNRLEKVVSSKDAVMVRKGKFSGVGPAAPRPSEPVKLNPAQFETLKKTTDNAKMVTKSNTKSKKSFRSVVPPGLSSKIVSSTSTELDKQVGSATGVNVAKAMMAENGPSTDKAPPPEGFFDKQSGKFAPPAGGFIDLNTALYVPPPPGSQFDPNTQVYVPPPTMGGFDPASGGYVPPAGFELSEKGEFIVDKNTAPSRGPASVGGETTEAVAPPPKIITTEEMATTGEIGDIATTSVDADRDIASEPTEDIPPTIDVFIAPTPTPLPKPIIVAPTHRDFRIQVQ